MESEKLKKEPLSGRLCLSRQQAITRNGIRYAWLLTGYIDWYLADHLSSVEYSALSPDFLTTMIASLPSQSIWM